MKEVNKVYKVISFGSSSSVLERWKKLIMECGIYKIKSGKYLDLFIITKESNRMLLHWINIFIIE